MASNSWDLLLLLGLGIAEEIDPSTITGISSVVYRRKRGSNIFAVRNGSHFVLRHVDFLSNRLVLRRHNRDIPIELMELEPRSSPGDTIAGRVALIVNEVWAARGNAGTAF